MIRPLLSCAVVLACGCASAPKTPDELIVGRWACVLSSLPSDAGVEYIAEFRQSRSMRLSLDGRFEIEGIDLDLKMIAHGDYRLMDGVMEGSFDDISIHRLLIDGEAADGDMLEMFETLMLEIANESVASTVDVLDEGELVLGADESPMVCTRAAT